MGRERELVQRLASIEQRLDAMRQLVGGVTTTELRSAHVTDEVFHALVDGLGDPNSNVRWWCVQLLDHIPDERALRAIARLLDDPVPRVRRNAIHALGCVACKPTWCAELPPGGVSRLEALAAGDENEKVRHEAQLALVGR